MTFQPLLVSAPAKSRGGGAFSFAAIFRATSGKTRWRCAMASRRADTMRARIFSGFGPALMAKNIGYPCRGRGKVASTMLDAAWADVNFRWEAVVTQFPVQKGGTFNGPF